MKHDRRSPEPAKDTRREERETELDSERMGDDHAITPQQEEKRQREEEEDGNGPKAVARFFAPSDPLFVEAKPVFAALWPPVLSAAEPLWRPWDPLWSQRDLGPWPPGTDPYRFGRNWTHRGTE